MGCKSYKPISIQLRPDENNDNQLSSTFYYLKNATPNSEQISLAKHLNLSKFIISEFEHNPQKSLQQFKNIYDDSLDSKSLFLLAFRNDSILIIADENNNNKLEDDRILVISKKILNSQPKKILKVYQCVIFKI